MKRIYPNYEVVIPRLAGLNCNWYHMICCLRYILGRNPALAGINCNSKLWIYLNQRLTQRGRNPALAGINCNRKGHYPCYTSPTSRNPALAGINCNPEDYYELPSSGIVAIPLQQALTATKVGEIINNAVVEKVAIPLQQALTATVAGWVDQVWKARQSQSRFSRH